MKILYVSQYFPPEMGAPAARVAELARHWTTLGHDVSVLTGFPNHPTGIVPTEWKARLRRLIHSERSEGVNIHRTWLWPLPNRKAHERIRNYVSFCLSAATRGMFLSRPDVVIATSPQLLVALAGWWLAAIQRVPFVFEVRDLWPESLTAVGVGSHQSFLHHSLAAVAGFLYKRADRIVVVTPAFKTYLIEHWCVPEAKISVVENGVETTLFSPAPEDVTCALRRQLSLENKIVVCYIGTVGMAHGLETLLKAAESLKSTHQKIHFLLIGEGAEKARIKSLAQHSALLNITFLDQQPRETIPAFISASDICLVLLRKTDVFKTVIPTKMLEFMSCARPVVLGVDGQARQFLEQAGAGIAIEPQNAIALRDAIVQLSRNAVLRNSLGHAGRNHILQNCSRRHTAERYIQILEDLLNFRLRPADAIPDAA